MKKGGIKNEQFVVPTTFIPERISWNFRRQIIFSQKKLLSFILKNGPIPASFCLFSFFSCYNFNTNWKSIDGVLGIWTPGRRIVGADETTELWWPPCPLFYQYNFLSFSIYLFPSLYHSSSSLYHIFLSHTFSVFLSISVCTFSVVFIDLFLSLSHSLSTYLSLSSLMPSLSFLTSLFVLSLLSSLLSIYIFLSLFKPFSLYL